MSILKKYQIFVSSTYTDLIEERQSAVEAILKAGHIPAGMELFTSSNKSQWEIIKRWIDESDIYMLILGGRYGSIEPESGKSYTHLEYEYASQINKPLFAIVMKEEVIAELKTKDTELNNPEKLKDFRGIVMDRMCAFFADEKDIKLAIHESLNNIIRDNLLIGWVRGTAQSENIAQENALLNDENRKLREEIKNLKAQQVQREPKLEMVINGGRELVYEFNIPESIFYKDRQPIVEIPSHLKSIVDQKTIDEYNQELKNITQEKIEEYNLIQGKIYAFENLAGKVEFVLRNFGNLKATGIILELNFPNFVHLMYSDDDVDLVVQSLKSKSLDFINLPEVSPVDEAQNNYDWLICNRSLATNNLTSKLSTFTPTIKSSTIHNAKIIQRVHSPSQLIKNRTIKIKLTNLLHDCEEIFGNYIIIPVSKGEGVVEVSIHCEEYLKMQRFEIPIIVK